MMFWFLFYTVSLNVLYVGKMYLLDLKDMLFGQIVWFQYLDLDNENS